MVKQEDPRVTAEHWKGLYEALAVVVEAQQRANDRLRAKNEALAERCERLEGALRDARLTMLAASDILEHEYLHPILEADVNDSIERIDAALSPSSGGGE
jgi:hypothetical protein